MQTSKSIDELDLSVRAFNCLKRANINTLADIFSLLDSGVENLMKLRNMGFKSTVEVLNKAKLAGYPIESAIDQYIELLRSDDDISEETIERWLNVKKDLPHCEPVIPTEHIGVRLDSLENMSKIIVHRLALDGIYTVEELLEKYNDEESTNLSPSLRENLVEVLDKNGYRFKSSSLEEWPDISAYLLYKKALGYTYNDIEVPSSIIRKLKTSDISIAAIVTSDLAFLKEHFSNLDVSVLLHAISDIGFRPQYIPEEQYPTTTDFILSNIEIPISDFDFSPNIVTKLRSHSITTANQLLKLSRKELINNKIIGPTMIGEIVRVLGINKLHLAGDGIYKCDHCHDTYFSVAENSPTHLCPYCLDKKKRVSKIRDFAVSVEGPKYGSYTDGKKGFTIFVTVHNKTKKMVEVEVKEFMLFSQDRQWAPSYNLIGYDFKKDYIMPCSSKTSAKIWSGYPWSVHKLEGQDYISFSIIANEKVHLFKFTMENEKLVLDDYHSY